MSQLFFAVPGDIKTQSGGYSYDRRLMLELKRAGRNVTHIELGASYPNPTTADADSAAQALGDLPAGSVVIIDGLALGAMDTEVVAGMRSQLVALVHHPLALEGGLDPARRAFLLQTERANLRFAKRVIVPSRHTAQLLVSDYAVPAEIITVARPGIEKPLGGASPVEPPLILSVGIQLPRKGHDVLLRAFANIAHLPWQAVIAGPAMDDTYSASLQKLTAELGLTKRVSFAGQVSAEELAGLYGSASIFALATRFEGYGMVFGEAMVHGLPIVSCDVGAVSETVSESAALLVPPDSPAAFAAALAKLLEDHQLRAQLSRAALAAGEKLISWGESARLVGEMLDSLHSGSDRGK